MTSTETKADIASKPVDVGREEDVNPPRDFEGTVSTNNDLPSLATQAKLEAIMVLDKHGKSHSFKSIYNGPGVARRVLIVFIRHFFCGNCQEYTRAISSNTTPSALLSLSIPTSIAIIGCGDPGLIEGYAEATKCPFEIYTDPGRKLYAELNLIETWDAGKEQPSYMSKSMLALSARSIFQGFKTMKSGLMLKSGNYKQVGGEFLFEPVDVRSPVEEVERKLDGSGGDAGDGEKKTMTWCHRMRTSRDHVEMPELMEVLGVNSEGHSAGEAKGAKKGVGNTLAAHMAELKGGGTSTLTLPKET